MSKKNAYLLNSEYVVITNVDDANEDVICKVGDSSLFEKFNVFHKNHVMDETVDNNIYLSLELLCTIRNKSDGIKVLITRYDPQISKNVRLCCFGMVDDNKDSVSKWLFDNRVPLTYGVRYTNINVDLTNNKKISLRLIDLDIKEPYCVVGEDTVITYVPCKDSSNMYSEIPLYDNGLTPFLPEYSKETKIVEERKKEHEESLNAILSQFPIMTFDKEQLKNTNNAFQNLMVGLANSILSHNDSSSSTSCECTNDSTKNTNDNETKALPNIIPRSILKKPNDNTNTNNDNANILRNLFLAKKEEEKLFRPSSLRDKILKGFKDIKKYNIDIDLKKNGIGGYDDVMNEIFRRALLPRTFSYKYRYGSTKRVKGIILHGKTGTGKTSIARAIAERSNCMVSVINGPEIFNKYIGSSEENIRRYFIEARKNKDIEHIIIFDEMDSICKKRGNDTDGRHHDSVVNQILSFMDGYEKDKNILIIGTTNRLDRIDDAMLRPGRFEVIIEVPLPSSSQRKSIFDIHTAPLISRKIIQDYQDFIDDLVNMTYNYSGADIEGLINDVISDHNLREYHIKKDDKVPNEIITYKDFEKVINKKRVDGDTVDISDINVNIIIDEKNIFNDMTSVLIFGDERHANTIATKYMGRRTMISVGSIDDDRNTISKINDMYNDICGMNFCSLVVYNFDCLIEYVSSHNFDRSLYFKFIRILQNIRSKYNKIPHIKNEGESIDRMFIITTTNREMVEELNMKKYFNVIMDLDESHDVNKDMVRLKEMRDLLKERDIDDEKNVDVKKDVDVGKDVDV
jgi:ATP-dependent 26S proteasome regulatory subunit